MNIASQITHYTKEWATIDKSKATFKWEIINWKAINKHVNKLQSRIAKAIIKGKLNLVKKLQHLLTNSHYAKLLAVKKVTSNRGKRTSGIDGKLWSSSALKYIGAVSLTNRKYRAKPLKRILIPKLNGKTRPLGIPTIYDRAMQALYALALDPVSESTADKNSYGFRKHRCTDDAIDHLFKLMAKPNHAEWVLEGDIKGCFDNISHEWMKENIPINKKILSQFLKSGYVFNKRLFTTKEGTPQGGIISPILVNMTLDGLEHLIQDKYWRSPTKHRFGRRYNKKKVNIIRYADDFVVTSKCRYVLEDIKEMIEEFLKERGLELSKEKTLITHINEGFDFLGFNIRKYKGKLLMKPSIKSKKNILLKIRKILRAHLASGQLELINALNPVIRGWCNYYKAVCSKETFQKLDMHIFYYLWRWAKRRHQNKSKNWIKERYWTNTETRDWIFRAYETKLAFASNTKIRRHIVVKHEANPYLKEYSDYYEMKKDKEKCKIIIVANLKVGFK